jgi:hypothetical protein
LYSTTNPINDIEAWKSIGINNHPSPHEDDDLRPHDQSQQEELYLQYLKFKNKKKSKLSDKKQSLEVHKHQ